MRKFLIGIFFLFLTFFFFYPIFKGFIPFPGDLLSSEYQPYRSYSYLGYNPGSIPNKGQGQDTIRMMYPWKYFSIEALKHGQMPLWNPYNFSGNPHFANLQSGTFYPENILFFLLPFNAAWAMYIMSQPFLAGVFLYIFLRSIGQKKASSFFGGVVFAYSSFMVVWLEYGNLISTFLWLPLALFFIDSFIKSSKILRLGGLIVCFLFSISGGYIQLFMYLYIISVSFAVYVLLRNKKNFSYQKTILLTSAFVVPFFLSAAILLPLFEIFKNSARNAYTFSELPERLIPLKNLITIVVPDFFGNPATRNYWIKGTYIERVSYIGIIPLLFSLVSWKMRKRGYVIFFISTAIASYVSTLNIFPVQLFHSLGFPFVSTGVPSRILSVYCFSMAVLASYGFSYWQEARKLKEFYIAFFILLGIVLTSWIFVSIFHYPQASITKHNLVLPTLFILAIGILLFIQKLISRKIILFVFFILTIFDLFFFFRKIIPFSPQILTYPKTEVMEKLRSIQGINRSWGYGSAFIDANLQLQERIYATDGYDPLFIKRYAEFVSSSKNGQTPVIIDRSNVNVATGYGESDLSTNIYRQKVLDLLGVKYILHKTSQKNPDTVIFPEKRYKLLWQSGDWQIYENKQALPRVFLAKNFVVEKDKRKILDLILDKNFDLQNTVILEKSLPSEFNNNKDENAGIVLEKYDPNTIIVKTRSESPSLLFLSDNYFPGWRVNIDGKPSTIYRADYTFRAVPVMKGKHQVEMWYHPDSFALGVKISTITFISLILYVVYNAFKKKRNV
ncbi:MAG: hypothetical protein A3J14_01850 [Candidatus Levybacteria bacterium RIFCSPLOWO2_02_FULL_37_18]|nr:MAG: hypothetical protein A3J14_01850 [Candidatus Levybacteria bacterium RIFCSPLOWO2_02_FULL_37_18]